MMVGKAMNIRRREQLYPGSRAKVGKYCCGTTKLRRWGYSNGREKKVKYGQIYSICARWIVAIWLLLSPVKFRYSSRAQKGKEAT